MRHQASRGRLKKYYYKKTFGLASFQNTWRKIIGIAPMENVEVDESDLNLYLIGYEKDIPYSQSYLTSIGNCIEREIDWYKYDQNPSYEINSRSLFDCFQGILQYIFFISENKLNTDQIEIHYSKANERNVFNPKAIDYRDKCDILNIFDYKSTSTYFMTPSVVNCYFGVTFKQIKIVPLCYSIRSDNSKDGLPHLDSFVFEGYNDDLQRWEILDERMNINDLIPPGGYGLYYVKTTTNSYSSFIIRQVEPGHNGMWGFSISAFEVHGIPLVREGEDKSIQNLEACQLDNYIDMPLTWNPCMELSEYL